MQAAALQAFGLPEVQTTPALRQSAMQLSLGMDIGTGLNLYNWQYGSEAPSVSMVLEAMDCHVSDPGCQSAGAKAQERLLEKSAKVICHTRFATLYILTGALLLGLWPGRLAVA